MLFLLWLIVRLLTPYGSETWPGALRSEDRGRGQSVDGPSFLYLMARRLVGMLLGRLRSEHAKDVEIAVLRHQLEVLRPR
jgi:hypothetical protein